MAKEEEKGRERVITVEYLQSTMSSQLLHKFPDNSAFDFDYTQSSIWSPLLPRMSSIALSKTKKKKTTTDKKLNKLKKTIQKKVSKKRVEFKATSSSSPAPMKAWNKVVKAAMDCFITKGRMKAIKFKELN